MTRHWVVTSSGAPHCSQLVHLGLEKERQRVYLITFQDKISYIVFGKYLPFSIFFYALVNTWISSDRQQICETFHLAHRVKKPSKVKLIIDTCFWQSTRAQVVTFTALDVTLSDCLSQTRLIASALDARLAGRSGMVVAGGEILRCELKLTEGVRSARRAC